MTIKRRRPTVVPQTTLQHATSKNCQALSPTDEPHDNDILFAEAPSARTVTRSRATTDTDCDYCQASIEIGETIYTEQITNSIGCCNACAQAEGRRRTLHEGNPS